MIYSVFMLQFWFTDEYINYFKFYVNSYQRILGNSWFVIHHKWPVGSIVSLNMTLWWIGFRVMMIPTGLKEFPIIFWSGVLKPIACLWKNINTSSTYILCTVTLIITRHRLIIYCEDLDFTNNNFSSDVSLPLKIHVEVFCTVFFYKQNLSWLCRTEKVHFLQKPFQIYLLLCTENVFSSTLLGISFRRSVNIVWYGQFFFPFSTQVCKNLNSSVLKRTDWYIDTESEIIDI